MTTYTLGHDFMPPGIHAGRLLDMASYDRFLAGELEDDAYPADAIAESLTHLPKIG